MTDKLVFTCGSNDRDTFNRFQVCIHASEIEENLNRKLTIDGITYHPSLVSEEIDIIIRLIQSNWCHIQTVALYDQMIPYTEIQHLRDILNEYFNLLHIALNVSTNDQQKIRYLDDMFECVHYISNCIASFDDLQPEITLKMAAVSVNNNKCPIYQYFHAYLEISYNMLILYHTFRKQSELDELIERIVQNLFAVSRKRFSRHSSGNEVIVCSCMRQLFVILQFLKDNTEEDSFWSVFNHLLKDDEPIFSLSLLKELAGTEEIIKRNTNTEIIPNFEFMDSRVKVFLTNCSPVLIPDVYKIVDLLVNRFWAQTARISVFQIIWEYYSKRLNVSNKNYSKLNAVDLHKSLEAIVGTKGTCKEDFEIFVAILLVHLNKHPENWAKMRGRIYSQLGSNKLKELNETGIAHVVLMFLALSTTFNDEMHKRILSMMDVLSKEKNELPIVWSIYMVWVFQNIKEAKDIEIIANGMKLLIQSACLESRTFYLVRSFFVDFKHCLSLSDNLTLNQWVFFDTWLSKYLTTCSIPELKTSMETFLKVLQTVNTTDCWILWRDTFKNHIFPPLKRIAATFNAPAEIGRVAGMICIMDLEMSESIFDVFTCDVSPRISKEFLLTVLDDYRNKFVLSEHQRSLFIQSWVKICLLSEQSNDEFTKKFLMLDIFPTNLKLYVGNAQNPLYALLEYLGSDIKNNLQSVELYKICDNTFGHIDRWLSQYLNQIDDEVVLYRIYTFISLAFFHCGRFLYNRNKISTPLTKLVDVALLPQEIMLGKSPCQKVMNAIKQTWHVFFEALANLNTDSDKYIERTLRDFITKYVPFFAAGDSPFIKCLKNEKTAAVLFEKIAASYFKHPVKEPDSNILKVLKILKVIFESTTSLPVIKIILNKVLISLFEFIILHPQRNAAFIVVKTITVSPLYPQFRREFSYAVQGISEKHLAHNTTNCFQLLFILAKFVPADMKNLLDVIKRQISHVERLRGVGFDKSLRLQYEKLQNVVSENLSSSSDRAS